MHITRKRKPLESAYHLGGSPLVFTKIEKTVVFGNQTISPGPNKSLKHVPGLLGH